ncbi:hypothetical protein [Streptomyces sp. NPDC049585]|uniref:hypothetical protein n=1 Tax=Streptomyces sp. NPDC049585 TaxID=3155154 RepID=UPI0034299B3D
MQKFIFRCLERARTLFTRHSTIPHCHTCGPRQKPQEEPPFTLRVTAHGFDLASLPQAAER